VLHDQAVSEPADIHDVERDGAWFRTGHARKGTGACPNG
jgi:hypothetical protein